MKAGKEFTVSFENRVSELSVGIDIGTTTISAAVIDVNSKEQIEVFSTPHDSYIGEKKFSEQSVSVMIGQAEGLLELIYKKYPGIVCIGITGQMHGIVYLGDDGKALSNLINWQDKRADLPIADGKSSCDMIKQLTGENISTGYGIATHYYNLLNGLVPNGAVKFCSIMDLLAMRLCGLKEPITHVSVAASFGLFDIKNNAFMSEKLDALGICESFLPRVTPLNEIIGNWNGIPISVAIGDNQASFLGSVSDSRESLLVNIGTGSQISAVGCLSDPEEGIELRPLIDGERLICGSALCGGSAYALIEGFFRSYASFIGMDEGSQYGNINALAEKAYESGERPLSVDTSFCGTRSDPSRRGTIENIDLNGFTPCALILGVIHGMCDELYKLYQKMNVKKTHIVASGGAVRKNTVLKKVLEDKFAMSVSICSVKEEAATGAALFSAYAIGKTEYKGGFTDCIKYFDQEKTK